MKQYKSVNIVPKVFYMFDFKGINLDIGAGKYLKATSILASKGCLNLRYDPHLLPTLHNNEIIKSLSSVTLDSITCNNVLNVIDKEERENIYKWIVELKQKNNCKVYFQIYEGDKNGIPNNKQNNFITSYYMGELSIHFKVINCLENIIVI